MKHSSRIAALVAAAALFTACGDDEPTDEGNLELPEQQRTATLNFASASDVYLLTVYSTPGISEASPAADVLYEMAAPAGTAGVRFDRVTRKPQAITATSINHTYWNARLAFEKSRRDGIASLSRELEATHGTLQLAKSQELRAACSCGDTQTCAPGSSTCVDTLSLAIRGPARTYTVVGTVTSPGGTRIKVVTDSAGASSAALTAIAEEFGAAADTVLDVTGAESHTAELDVDGSESLTVAFTNNFGDLPNDVVGVFLFGDYLESGAQATGNRSDILWARLPGGTTTDELLIGTLAHEYQHLVSFALRSKLGDPVALRETLWLDEGTSHLMEDLTGWGGSTVDAYALGLESWDSAPFAGPADSVAQRGRAYMMLRYLVDQRARAAGATDAKSSQVRQAARDVIAPLYTGARRGFQHALFQDARRGGGIVDWLRANFTTGNPDYSGPANEQFLATTTSPNANGQLIGFNPYAEYTNARGESVQLGGPQGVDDSNDSGFSAVSDSIAASGARYYLVTGGEGTVTITLTADDATDINVDAVKVN